MSGSPGDPEPVKRLLQWYERNRRVLPWRASRDPYAILVSEFMLHQTRVETVIPYYLRFLERFPDWSALATATLDQVLKVWEGLGYYARARNLHALAREVCTIHGGRLPSSAAELLALPGIGEYTAGALLSIYFGHNVAAIDGNVRRVICRVSAIADDPQSGPGREHLLQVAQSLVAHGRAGDVNQALMDLGTAVCTPRKPACASCPLASFCLAYERGLQESLPVRRPRKPLPHYDMGAALICHHMHILIAQRPTRGLLGGLWEFPGGRLELPERQEAALQHAVRDELGVEITVVNRLAAVRHAYTHFRITLTAYQCHYLDGEPRALGCADWRWVAPDELDRFAFSTAHRKLLPLAQAIC